MTVRVLRGRADDPGADREATAAMLARTGETGQAAVRVWAPHRQVAFGRRDANRDGYEAARRAAERRGYRPIERSVGGRAVAYTGETTLAFAHAVPLDDVRRGMNERYDAATATLLAALRGLGVDASEGEPPDSFCPGDHSIRAGGKLVGIAQRVRRDAALVSGCVLVAERDELVSVLTAVYDALALPFAPASVGTVADAGGPPDPERVARAVEDALVDGRARQVETVA